MKQEQLDLIWLCSCMVNGIQPEQSRVGAMDLEAVHALARWQTLSAITYYAVEDYIDQSAELAKAWRQERDMAIRKNIALDFERSRLLAVFEERGIRHMPLKGAILKDMYPKLGMRQMADNDVLYDKAHQKAVYDIFLENGYTCEDFGHSHHDVYMKAPFYNFEMHSSMLDQTHKLYFYYDNIWDRLKQADGRQYEYHFTDEDFYIFLIIHAHKHFSGGGTGLRTLLDLYVYTRAKPLDLVYIGDECEKAGLRAFEAMLRELAWAVFAEPDTFGPEALAPELQETLRRLLASGTYGTVGQAIRSKLAETGADAAHPTGADKLKYLLRRTFPDADFMKGWCRANFAAALKCPVLLPVAYLYRLVFKGCASLRKVRAEIRILRGM